MATILDTFVTKFRFESDRSGLTKMQGGLQRFQQNVSKLGVAIGAIVGGALIGKMAENIDSMGKFADSVGISVSQLDAFQFAAQRAGVPVSDLRTSLQGLQRVIGEVSIGQGTTYIQTLAKAGVAIRDQNGQILNTTQLLTELNQKFQQLPRSQQFNLAQQLGITRNTVQLLQRTPKEFESLINQAQKYGVITQADFVRSAKFEDSLVNLKQAFTFLESTIGTLLLPTLSKLINGISSFIAKHKALVAALVTIAGAIAGIRIAILALSAAGAIMDAVFSPIILVIGGIAIAVGAVVLAIQDIWVGLKGGHSVILSWIKSSKFLMSIWHGIKNIIHEIKVAIQDVEAVFGKIANSSIVKRLEKPLTSKEKKLTGTDFFNSPILGGAIVGSSKSAAASAISSANTSNRTLNVGGITVNTTGGNPDDIARAVDGRLRNQFSDSAEFFNSGILR